MGCQVGGLDRDDPGQGWRLRHEQPAELGDARLGALDLEHHSRRVVAAGAGQPEPVGKPGDVRPEADALDDAAHHEATAYDGLAHRPEPGTGGHEVTFGSWRRVASPIRPLSSADRMVTGPKVP
jgi:hypothetical protein